MFLQAGCAPAEVTEERIRRKDPLNIICTLHGSSHSVIIVSVYTDHADLGEGVVDDWSGAALLLALVESLRAVPRRRNFVFVAFTDGKEGLVGSRYYVRHWSHEQVSGLCAVVNLECLGLTRTKVWADRANRKLLAYLTNVCWSLKVDLKGVNVERIGDNDAHPFVWKHVPEITIHSVTQNP